MKPPYIPSNNLMISDNEINRLIEKSILLTDKIQVLVQYVNA